MINNRHDPVDYSVCHHLQRKAILEPNTSLSKLSIGYSNAIGGILRASSGNSFASTVLPSQLPLLPKLTWEF